MGNALKFLEENFVNEKKIVKKKVSIYVKKKKPKYKDSFFTVRNQLKRASAVNGNIVLKKEVKKYNISPELKAKRDIEMKKFLKGKMFGHIDEN